MSEPVEVALNRADRRILEGEAAARGMEIAAHLRELATAEGKACAKLGNTGAHVASNADARELYRDWGAPQAAI